jgi:Type II CAAX prenyl endopeptidase Rce1-like
MEGAEPGREKPEAEARLEEILRLSAEVRADPTVRVFVRLIWKMVVWPLRDPVGLLLASAVVLIMLWGREGNLQLVSLVWSGWDGPGSDPDARDTVIPGIPWDQEWISFFAGGLLLVVIPCLLIKLVFKHDLRDYGLGLPGRENRKLTVFATLFLFAVSLPAFLLSTGDSGMEATYPLYRGEFDNGWEFAIYELGYLVFFVVIEFIFRGYLLLGLFNVKDRVAYSELVTGERGPLLFGYYAIFISMLSYTAWHLGKPTPELWGTLIWGAVAGAVVLLIRSIWPLVAVHWLLNVILDLILWK